MLLNSLKSLVVRGFLDPCTKQKKFYSELLMDFFQQILFHFMLHGILFSNSQTQMKIKLLISSWLGGQNNELLDGIIYSGSSFVQHIVGGIKYSNIGKLFVRVSDMQQVIALCWSAYCSKWNLWLKNWQSLDLDLGFSSIQLHAACTTGNQFT